METSIAKVMLSGRPISDHVSVVVTTSPVRSNPSTDLIEEVFESFQFVSGLTDCYKIIVCDGYNIHDIKCEKRGRINKSMEENYKEYVSRLQCLTKSNPLFQNSKCVVLEGRHGFGHAVKAGLNEISTKFVMIVQHDFAFCKQIQLERLVGIMNENPAMKYVGFLSASTENYAMWRNHGPNQQTPLEIDVIRGEPFVKLLFWYDKIHIADTEFYRQVVFGSNCCIRKGDFIEDRLGHWQLKKIYEEGMAAHCRFGTFLWYPDNGDQRYIQHLEGRKFQLEKTKIGLYPERTNQRHVWKPLTVQRFERQAQRSRNIDS